ncbi:DUF2244 domain-containing protein [Porticoccus litoralis]|uniref:DUF2244 domain-containing protein n=1 Tax=Porticoccus litoralis TaxID=434086 RepID=A0AAW8B8T5_9GAMM|nr:DUF2244 domain-containing protein [Porticoccus litoralis]MDP1521344.1 DUF2244 domain-containing protein [Porticoccus litoralis]TNE92477.1 MAG: DUF2244 domain-containing protein [Gammaproteobacteria bacterium]
MVTLHTLTNHALQLVLTPNRSMDWNGNLLVLLGASSILLVTAAIFALKGAWLVLPFAGLEIAALAAAMHLTLRKLDCQEVLTLENGVLKLERGKKTPDLYLHFPEQSIRILVDRPSRPMSLPDIDLVALGHCYHLGSFLSRSDRFRLAGVLKNKMHLQVSSHDPYLRTSF